MKKVNELFLSDRVFVNEQFARSTRIDYDDISNSGFIYSQSIDNFLKVLASHRRSAVKQGAFTWTGPYGSGKSTLALSFSSVLVKDLAHRTSASKSYNKDTVITLWNAFNPGANGWKTLNIVGDTTSLEDLLKNNIKKAFPKFSKPLDTSNNLLDALDDISNADPDGGGLLIIVDELGKLLEGLFRNSSRGDLIFYQEIGERAARSNGRLVFIGILHQSFQDYAGSIKSMRDEWGKVHGRFVDVSINLSSEEQLELIASAINSNVKRTAIMGHRNGCDIA
jgi:energy-coupling factor transporter ATP-binding protein EcfA2